MYFPLGRIRWKKEVLSALMENPLGFDKTSSHKTERSIWETI